MTSISTRTQSIDAQLRERAARVIPGEGMYGHMRFVGSDTPAEFPQFFERGSGAHIWDADGNEYVDFFCAFGPMILGYRNERVERAAAAQAALGDVLSGPTARMVELAERLTDSMPSADWAIFAKNGTDATTIGMMIARATTGGTKILKARNAYHGANPFFTPSSAGVAPEDRANLVEFEYNDIESMREAAASVEGQLAGIIVVPFLHDVQSDQEDPNAEFARAARRLADERGALLILDEVRTTLRIDPRGAWERYGVTPDVTALSKSLANGHSLSAVVGKEHARRAAGEIYVTGSFWYGGVSHAAALATLDEFEAMGGVARLEQIGSLLRNGLAAQAQSHGIGLRQTGPVQMPMIAFDGDEGFAKALRFSGAAARRGVLLHPWHTNFISLAHDEADLARVLEATDGAFEELASSGLA